MSVTLVCANCMGTGDVWEPEPESTTADITRHIEAVHDLHGAKAAAVIMTTMVGADLVVARKNLAMLKDRALAARDRSEHVTVGGITGYDTAVLSGTMRKPNPKKQAARLNAYDAEAAAWALVATVENKIRGIEASIRWDHRHRAVAFTRDELKASTHIRTELGWHAVVRVNKTSVSVATGYSWVDRVPLAKVREVRKVAAA